MTDIRATQLPIALRVLLAGATAGYAWWAMSLRPSTWPEHLAVLLPGVVLVSTGAVARARDRARPTEAKARHDLGPSLRTLVDLPADERPAWLVRGLIAWSVTLAALVGFEVLNFFLSPRSDHPTISSIVDQLDELQAGRVVVFLLWLALGWDLVRR
jgi:hypothetical protein